MDLAGDLSVGFALTHHALPGAWNERHPYVRYETPENWTFGAFRNSEGRLSLTGGYTFRDDGPVSLETGLATGYSAAPVVPMVRVQYETGPARWFVMPAATEKGDLGAVFGVEADLWRSR